MRNSNEILPGWILKVEKTSNNSHLFIVSDINGYKSEIEDSDLNNGLQKCLDKAFDIEQKIGKNRNKFFYDILINLINDISGLESMTDL